MQRITIIALISLFLSLVAATAHYHLRQDQYQYVARLQFPEMYVFDSYFEILPLTQGNSGLKKYSVEDYDRIRVELDQVIQREIATPGVQLSLNRGIVTVSMTSKDAKATEKLVRASSHALFNFWDRRIKILKRPIHDYVKKLDKKIAFNQKLLGQYQNDSFTHSENLFKKTLRKSIRNQLKIRSELQMMDFLASKDIKRLQRPKIMKTYSSEAVTSPDLGYSLRMAKENSISIFDMWNSKVSLLKGRLDEYISKIDAQNKKIEGLIELYDSMGSIERQSNFLKRVNASKRSELQSIHDELLLMKDLTLLSLDNVKKPVILQEATLTQTFKRSPLKSGIIFIILSGVSLSVSLSIHLTRHKFNEDDRKTKPGFEMREEQLGAEHKT